MPEKQSVFTFKSSTRDKDGLLHIVLDDDASIYEKVHDLAFGAKFQERVRSQLLALEEEIGSCKPGVDQAETDLERIKVSLRQLEIDGLDARANLTGEKLAIKIGELEEKKTDLENRQSRMEIGLRQLRIDADDGQRRLARAFKGVVERVADQLANEIEAARVNIEAEFTLDRLASRLASNAAVRRLRDRNHYGNTYGEGNSYSGEIYKEAESIAPDGIRAALEWFRRQPVPPPPPPPENSYEHWARAVTGQMTSRLW